MQLVSSEKAVSLLTIQLKRNGTWHHAHTGRLRDENNYLSAFFAPPGRKNPVLWSGVGPFPAAAAAFRSKNELKIAILENLADTEMLFFIFSASGSDFDNRLISVGDGKPTSPGVIEPDLDGRFFWLLLRSSVMLEVKVFTKTGLLRLPSADMGWEIVGLIERESASRPQPIGAVLVFFTSLCLLYKYQKNKTVNTRWKSQSHHKTTQMLSGPNWKPCITRFLDTHYYIQDCTGQNQNQIMNRHKLSTEDYGTPTFSRKKLDNKIHMQY